MNNTALRVSLLAVLFLTAVCSKHKDPVDGGNADGIQDLHGPYLGQTPPGNEPRVFASGVVSTEQHEGPVVAYPGGNELYFVRFEDLGADLRGRIVGMKVQDGHWTEPQVVSFSGTYADAYVAMHPDGSRLYFQSDRPIDPSESTFTWNIWYVDRVGDGWSAAHPIGRPINGRNDVSGPSVTSDGTLYYTLMTLGGPSDIYRSQLVNGEYQEPEKLPDSVNSVEQQFDSYVAPDESYLLFNAYQRSDTYGSTDLYISFRDGNDQWSAATNLGPTVNGADAEGSATITPDGQYVFFGRYNNAEHRGVDVYWLSAQYLASLRR